MGKTVKKNTKKVAGQIIPLGDRVLIKQAKRESKTAGGIILPDSVSEDKCMKEGTVIAVGEGKFDDGKRVPMDVKKGDVVLFQWGDEVKIGDQEYFLVSESGIVAKIG